MQVKSVGKISQGISQPNKRHIIFYNIPRTSYRYAKLEEAKFAIVEGKGAIVGRVVFFFFFGIQSRISRGGLPETII